MSLYQAYRPTCLADMVGSESTIKGLTAHFKQEHSRISHAHIIHGASGCGKTTLARAIAKDVLGATDLTIHEINTASNRGIDTAREIIDQMKLLPLGGGAVVYIIDEAHGMTTDAKRSFLKPLEDCPDHCYFFLCTTNLPQLLKGDEGKAIGTRCTQWKVEPLNNRQVGKLVDRVATAEKYELDDELLSAIVNASNGSPRAALVALEKVMGIQDRGDQLKVLENPTEEDPDIIDLCRLLVGRGTTWAQVAEQLKLLKGSQEPEAIRRCVLGFVQGCLLKRYDPAAARVLEAFEPATYDIGFPGITLACARSREW